ncbi:hypothetical protein CTI12_AA317600 [Artemisia annua]|uniref:Helitron helicase-like domain-containing protein n=1 Tax=Artemisia annua TaxID=35608 RepID=A0A2U1N1W2_ARTAN|nr:hypothetical protein CTI12_AA317600 [Artemisia annua]
MWCIRFTVASNTWFTLMCLPAQLQQYQSLLKITSFQPISKEQQKWVQKQARYRRRKNNCTTNDCGNSYCCTADGTSQPKTMQQEHEVVFCKNPKPSTLQTIQTSRKDLQGGQNLPQHPLFNNHFANVTQDHRKRKTPTSDPPTIQSDKKKVKLPHGCSHLTSHTFYHHSVPVSKDEGCSQIQQHAVGLPTHSTMQNQLTHEQTNIENQKKFKNKTSTMHYRNRKRQNTYEKPASDTSVQQLKRQHTNANSSMCSTETQNEGVSHLYIDLGDADYACQYCNATFWYGEKLKGNCHRSYPKYTKCCGGGQVYLTKEMDPPEFLKNLFRNKHFLDNIQLYSVSGAQEYQLPSSGTLGGIVFQPDANSQIDYDIIVEYKDRQPKRINKLHSSYMSLQFPLLFVYGQPGYNTNMTLKATNGGKKRSKLTMNMYYKYQLHERMSEANIKDLNPTSRNKILEAKVYRSWIGRNPPDLTEKSYHAILLDRQGDAIQANMEVSEKKTVHHLSYPWKNLSNLRVHMCSYKQLTANVGKQDIPFIYPIHNSSRSRRQDSKSVSGSNCRNSVELTLWDDLAESFPKGKIDALEKPIIIAVSSCRVARFRNNLQLSSTPATYYYINPDIPELPQYRAE